MPRNRPTSISKTFLLCTVIFVTGCTEKERLIYKAEHGDVVAMRELGKKYCLMYDREFPNNLYTAIEWLTKASEKGDIEAMNKLAGTYELWPEHEKKEKAFYWYSKAAEKGSIHAMLALAQAYDEGDLNRKRDPNMWKYWMDRINSEHARTR